MKLRIEPGGYHYYDRNTGIHLLVDEIKPIDNLTLSPRTISIAITNKCNANCSFCHISKGEIYLSKNFLLDFCKQIDSIGTFDIAIGGGEPLLHPDLTEICQAIWQETNLGISITTNGQLLSADLIKGIKNFISFIRISLDTLDNSLYRKIRNFSLDSLINNLNLLSGEIPFGLNMVVSSETLKDLDKMLEFAINIKAEELLLLPLINNGEFALTESEWFSLERWINQNYNRFPLKIIEHARKQIKIPLLFEDDEFYKDYLYLSADKIIKESSYVQDGLKLDDNNIKSQILNFFSSHKLRSK